MLEMHDAVAVHSVAGADSAHTSDIRRLLVPAVGSSHRLGRCTLFHSATAGRRNRQNYQAQRTCLQGLPDTLYTLLLTERLGYSCQKLQKMLCKKT